MKGTVECIDRIRFCVELIRTRTGIILPYPRISFDLRGAVAGRAFYAQNMIKINPILLAENPEDFVARTPGHEVAHLAAFRGYGYIEPHGREWAAMMAVLGQPAIRCHNYDTAIVRGIRSKPLCHEVLE